MYAFTTPSFFILSAARPSPSSTSSTSTSSRTSPSRTPASPSRTPSSPSSSSSTSTASKRKGLSSNKPGPRVSRVKVSVSSSSSPSSSRKKSSSTTDPSSRAAYPYIPSTTATVTAAATKRYIPSSSSSSSLPLSQVFSTVSPYYSSSRQYQQENRPTRPRSRFIDPVPEALPHEIIPPKRGRNSGRKRRAAEHLRRYMYLRRLLKPWSEQFRDLHGRTPTLVDVHESGVPGLLDRFIEYLDALEGIRLES